MLLLEASNGLAQNAGNILQNLASNWLLVLGAIVFIIIAIIVLFFLKQILINTILGLIAWGLLQFVFQVKLDFWISLIVSIIFGIGGLGVLLLLKLFGIPV
jgi:hypothetical protein